MESFTPVKKRPTTARSMVSASISFDAAPAMASIVSVRIRLSGMQPPLPKGPCRTLHRPHRTSPVPFETLILVGGFARHWPDVTFSTGPPTAELAALQTIARIGHYGAVGTHAPP
ncbi:MAG: hypothetical protein M5U07_18945 [Xanthobacteraceae bacterium]|nr:hypothetical protein [Xanthobacteraceae bacterium]